MGGGGSGGGSSTNTVTQTQQIPQYEQQFSQANQNLAQSLASQPYPTYNAPLLANFNPAQYQGMAAAQNAAGSYQPDLAAAESTTQGGLNSGNQANFANAASNLTANAVNSSANNPGVINSYMNPYLQSSLNPQIANLNQEIGIQQLGNNAGAAQAGAFGDARQGVASGLTNYYGDQALNQLVSQGYNTAYNNAQSAAQQQQAFGLQGANTLGQLGQQGLQQQALQLQGGQQLADLGQLQQQLGLTGANALYGTGALQQQQQQQGLNLAYQQFQNQAQWPYQMLNVRESALSNSPYNIANQTTLPNASQLASGVGAFGSLAGLLGSLGGNSNGNLAPFGGQALNNQ